VSTLTIAQVYALARAAGLDPARALIATAIAQAESGLRTDAIGDVGLQDATWGPSVGLWQIRSVKAQSGKGTPRDATRLTDPTFNATAMMSISGQGTNWHPWSTYTNGAYLKNIAAITPAAASVNADPSWQDKLHTALLAIPGAAQVQSAAASTTKTVTAAAADTASSLNPFAVFTGWDQKALALGLKITMVGAGLALVVVGAVRLVAPAAQGAVSSALGAGS
jgi:hypothetical protein